MTSANAVFTTIGIPNENTYANHGFLNVYPDEIAVVKNNNKVAGITPKGQVFTRRYVLLAGGSGVSNATLTINNASASSSAYVIIEDSGSHKRVWIQPITNSTSTSVTAQNVTITGLSTVSSDLLPVEAQVFPATVAVGGTAAAGSVGVATDGTITFYTGIAGTGTFTGVATVPIQTTFAYRAAF